MQGQPISILQTTNGTRYAQQARRNPGEQRTAVRYALQIPVTYRWIEQGTAREAGGCTRDVSVRGAYVITGDCPPCGANLWIKMSFPRGSRRGKLQWIDAEGSVVRVENPSTAQGGGFVVESQGPRLFTR